MYTVFVGSGVGSAIIANGKLVNGGGGVAGELGHIKVVPNGRRCGCGELGCLEAYAGGHNLIAQTRELLATGRSHVLTELTGGDPARVTPVTLEQAAEAGDAEAREIYERASLMLALAVANQVTVLNPARLILGGGVLAHCPGIRRRVLEGVQAYASTTSREGLLISDAELGDDSGLIGAALLAYDRGPGLRVGGALLNAAPWPLPARPALSPAVRSGAGVRLQEAGGGEAGGRSRPRGHRSGRRRSEGEGAQGRPGDGRGRPW